jgi:integrase
MLGKVWLENYFLTDAIHYLEDQRLHNTRHTYASILLSNGESLVYVKEQLGHSSIQMTVDIYGHLIPNSNRKAVNRLENMHPNAPHPHPPKTEKPQPFGDCS